LTQNLFTGIFFASSFAAFETIAILTFMFIYVIHANPESALIADIPGKTF
jgi:hypothetical protein